MTTDVLIRVEALEKHFGSSIHALNGVDAEIRRGEVVVVIGPSGSGKSTFLRCLNLLEMPTAGKITFEGVDITDPKVNINRHRQKMGMVFQHFNLFPNMTVLRNMTIAPVKLGKKSKEAAEGQARQLLERVGLADRADAYPNQLSGGQKQRIAIVRALCMEPDVMLFDEPTSALDPEMVGEVGRPRDLHGRRAHHRGGHPREDVRAPRERAPQGVPGEDTVRGACAIS